MELSNVNSDVETLKLILTIASSVIGILLLIVAFFLQKQIKVQETLTVAVNHLTTAVTVIQEQQNERDPRTEKRLNDHADRLDNHAERLTKIETKCVYYHGASNDN